MFKRVFFPMVNYPFPTLPANIWQAISVAQILNAELYGLSLEMQPPEGLGYGTYTMPFVGSIIAAEEVKASANKEAVAHDFIEQARKGGVRNTLVKVPCFHHQGPALCAAAAQFCDISVLPVDDSTALDQWYAEEVIFSSGHPCLILPQAQRVTLFQRVVVAWDGSRAAIRSISDAIPLLQTAADILVVTAAPDKIVEKAKTDALLDHLSRHNITALAEVIETQEQSSSEAITHRANSYRADLLVIGAFGHSRLRDFVLGGVTRDMLSEPPLPVFMAY
jgi:nucleotide-binding universal stress UspA family protein